MHHKRKSEAPISLIAAIIVGLIIITIVTFMIGKKTASFVEGKENVRTCNNACNAIGKDTGSGVGKGDCIKFIKGVPLFGDYIDVSSDLECCCYNTP